MGFLLSLPPLAGNVALEAAAVDRSVGFLRAIDTVNGQPFSQHFPMPIRTALDPEDSTPTALDGLVQHGHRIVPLLPELCEVRQPQPLPVLGRGNLQLPHV